MSDIVDTAGLLRSMAAARWADVYEHRGAFLEIADELDRLNAQALELCAEISGLRRENERLRGLLHRCLTDEFGIGSKALRQDIDAALAGAAVQPEGCCLDYPRCDCNSPPELAQEPKGCNHFPGQVNCEWCTEVPHE